MNSTLACQGHRILLVNTGPQRAHTEQCPVSFGGKLQPLNVPRVSGLPLTRTPQTLQCRGCKIPWRGSSQPFLEQQNVLRARIGGAVKCTASVSDGTSRDAPGARKAAVSSSNSTLGQEGEEPYRILPGGRKVYLKELDVIAFLEEENFLRPLDPLSYNSASYLWKKIDNIPEERRPGLVDLLEPRHLTKMWKIAGRRYKDLQAFPQSTKAFAMMPTSEAEGVFHFEGLVNDVPWPVGWLKRFSKAFFVSGDGKVYGRVIGGGKFLEDRVKSLFPLYFRVKRVKAVVPTDEPCELQFDYGNPQGQLQLAEMGVPEGFPAPAKHVYPFSDALYDYLRPVGPGVLIGQTWHEGNDPNQTPRQFHGEFILILNKSPK